ncbi:hypothetical protein JCM19239_3137 [Vibrio variabilis]|uniref:Uncharacterized protein n=1 Tax=Vibrio variabilis TaxID=990271 RepID=A0ABQ0JP48_9VIBR|nr:hypothetical protein JCM19239_3137 [Vibrio variabilis]
MNTKLSTLEQFARFDKLVIHSLEMSLYQASVILDGEEHYVTHDNGSLLRTHNVVDMRRLCQNLTATETVLRQDSAYDEMVGSPIRAGENTLEVPLGRFDSVM